MLPKDLVEKSGLRDLAAADNKLQTLVGQGVTDDTLTALLSVLLPALSESADPDQALTNFVRWFSAVGNRSSYLQFLIRHDVALKLFCQIAGSSQFFADLLIRQPEYFEIIANPGVRGNTRTATQFFREASSLIDTCQLPELKRDALRRWKAREMLRIGVRDLLGLVDMPATAREFSNLADVCVHKALEVALIMHSCETVLPFAIIGMGKLGGQELNYSSDIDLMFIHGDGLPLEVINERGRKVGAVAHLTRVAEALIKVLSEDSANGHVFRVDMRLRPEGRFGPLTRSLSGYRAYYESWAENWEWQALLKARFVAGDYALGEAFHTLVEPYVYRRHVPAALLDDVIHNKRRIEQQAALEGETDTNVKTGYGGIRDVEFLVQKFQLQYGGARSALRTPATLEGLRRLCQAGLLTTQTRDELTEDYIFLRNLEHRLQLLHGFQTQVMPPASNDRERTFLARRMGFPSRAPFEAELSWRRERVRGYLDRLFYGAIGEQTVREAGIWSDLNDLLDNIGNPTADERLKVKLNAAGFQDASAAVNFLHLPMRGNEFGEMPPDTPVEFKAVASRLLELCRRSPSPDDALAGVEAVSLAVPNRAQLYAAFDDSHATMERLVTLAAVSPPLVKRLTRRLEWFDSLFSPEDEEEGGEPAPGIMPEVARNMFLPELRQRVELARKPEARLESVARYWLRETLRIGARDTWHEIDAAGTMAALTQLSEAVLEVVMSFAGEAMVAAHPDREFAAQVVGRVALIGLGKLGGAELGYSSDWDAVFVYADPPGVRRAGRGQESFMLASAVAERTLSSVTELARHGAPVELDLRLRPWGRKGAMIYTPRGYAQYYKLEGETWERQAALKARHVAGNMQTARRCERVLQAVSYGHGLNPDEDEAVRAMKRRIENERLKPSERETDLKLGYGGLTDIEWLCQRFQLLHGGKRISLRTPNTLRALSALAAARLLDNAEANALRDTYLLLTRLRNALWLSTGTGHDAFPDDPHRRLTLARHMGYEDAAGVTAGERLWTDVSAAMRESRRIFARRFEASSDR